MKDDEKKVLNSVAVSSSFLANSSPYFMVPSWVHCVIISAVDQRPELLRVFTYFVSAHLATYSLYFLCTIDLKNNPNHRGCVSKLSANS